MKEVHMKFRSLKTIGVLPVAAALILACAPAALAATAEIGSGDARRAERGAYLVRMFGCSDCHTPLKMGPKGPEPDMTRSLSGHPETLVMPPAPALGPGPWVWVGSGTNTAFAGPWGVSFAANLTPDRETGLGAWTAQTFKDALRRGRHEGQGRPILPPMPYQALGTATDEDLEAVFAYLRTLPAIRNRVPQPVDPPESGQGQH
jgi:mono/diheme cytochrome c family protein